MQRAKKREKWGKEAQRQKMNEGAKSREDKEESAEKEKAREKKRKKEKKENKKANKDERESNTIKRRGLPLIKDL